MRSGKLDNTIQILRQSYVDDGFGGQEPGPIAVVATLRAQIIQSSTEEFYRAYGVSSEMAIVFRTRHIDGVTLSDKIRHDSRDLNIKEIKPIGRRRGLEIRCSNGPG
jgi:SPP1 family predicted phage head-tail adaptor